MTREIFEHPEYYENVVRVNNAFAEDAPDIIIDPQQLFKGYLERIPALKKDYVLTGSGEYHRVKKKQALATDFTNAFCMAATLEISVQKTINDFFCC